MSTTIDTRRHAGPAPVLINDLDLGDWIFQNGDGITLEDEAHAEWLQKTGADVASLTYVQVAALRDDPEQFADAYVGHLYDDICNALDAHVLPAGGFLDHDELQSSAVEYAAEVSYRLIRSAYGLS